MLYFNVFNSSLYEAPSWKKKYHETTVTLKVRSFRKINMYSEYANSSHRQLRVFLYPLPSPLLAIQGRSGPLLRGGLFNEVSTLIISVFVFLSVRVQSIKRRVV